MSPGDLEGRAIAIVGGTGVLGRGLARRFAAAGLTVTIGSRDSVRAEDLAAQITADGHGPVVGTTNSAAAKQADIVVIAVPWKAHEPLLRELRVHLAGKIVVDCVNPIGFDRDGPYMRTIPEGSAAGQAAALLPDAAVVGAFHHVSGALLWDLDVASIETDVLVVGDHQEANEVARALAEAIPGVRGVSGGSLRSAHQVEALTASLVTINNTYSVQCGIRITGL